MSSSGASGVTNFQSRPLPEFRLLLDQGFPKPPGFTVASLDETVEVVHLFDFDPELSRNSTPDWMVYCIAAEAGFDGLVARDRSQLDQLAEMYVLSRLRGFSVITWRKAIEDPVREWGQLLAYLPEVKKKFDKGPGKAIILPSPVLGADNIRKPVDTIGIEAKNQKLSVDQIRRQALDEIRSYMEIIGDDPARFDDLLGFR